jgi:GTP-binding protein
LFVGSGVEIYKGQIVGIHQRAGDLALNACKKKAATNVRSNKEQTGIHFLLHGDIEKLESFFVSCD